jgi:hypothetical protein
MPGDTVIRAWTNYRQNDFRNETADPPARKSCFKFPSRYIDVVDTLR